MQVHKLSLALWYQQTIDCPDKPDLLPNDYHTFGPLRVALGDKKSSVNKKVKMAMYPCSKTKEFFSYGIEALVKCFTYTLNMEVIIPKSETFSFIIYIIWIIK